MSYWEIKVEIFLLDGGTGLCCAFICFGIEPSAALHVGVLWRTGGTGLYCLETDNFAD